MSKADRHSEAILGIHLAQHGRSASGSPPSDEELALLMEGGLGAQRRTEVLSHLAARPDRYRQWQTMVEMAAQPAANPSLLAILTRGLNNWLIDWRYAFGSMAVIGLTLFIYQQVHQPSLENLQEAETAATADYAQEFAAAPAADEEQTFLQERQLQEEKRQAQKAAPKSQPAMALVCAPLMHPQSNEAGRLCSVAGSDGRSTLVWQAKDASGRHLLGNVHENVLQLKISSSQRWFALQTAQAIYVQSIDDLFADNSQRTQLPFNSATATLAWQGDILVISVLQALGDSDDDLKYRFDPASGELQPKP
ncbi:hypothetical protein FHR99_003056 [Litorivivens lipolytica]|uniref:Uncharacterized protein n=1 Tax=Litorivivens lipolytica TaxID=1524264 RepID=A0A7W4Z707_9GAMM|nr:hypothetical protein [Litorivivens lipolytica]MBB3048782.1 hypothetical protein [Litorivivens lipolytica]